MPYMHFYIDQLKRTNCEIHLLYWDRDGKPDSKAPEGITTYKLESYIEDSLPLMNKIPSFIKYRSYAYKVLKNQRYDLLIVLHSTPGVLLFDVLMSKYKEKYILDYRDFTYENIKFYKRLIHQLVKSSIATFVSSDAYRKFLPKVNKIYTSHNLIAETIKYRDVRRSKPRGANPIKIRYWGFIRHTNINLNIINRLANDMRFELHYHGREQETGRYLKKYCVEKEINNVFFHGEYKPVDRYVFARETDLLHNIYENDIKTTNAMGNKYYDGITFCIPQLCNQGSFMGEEVTKNGIGLECNPEDEDLGNDIFEYYNTINWNTFEKKCDQEVVRIMKELDDGSEVLMTIEQRSSSI